MRVVVITGSREWTDVAAIESVLRGCDMLIVGDCPTGADAIAYEVSMRWAMISAKVDVEGPRTAVNLKLRNQAVADRAAKTRMAVHPSGIVEAHAFVLPQCRGTWDCVTKLKRHGFKVEVHRG